MLTVTTPASSLALLTLAELQAATGVTDSGRKADLLQFGLEVAAAITSACNVAADGANPPTLLLETLTETLRLDRAVPRLRLARRPIAAVTSVTECGIELTSDDYEIDARTGLLLRLWDDRSSLWRHGKIVIAYSAGLASVPDDLRRAAKRAATALWAEGGRDPNLKRTRVEGISEREYWVAPKDDPLFAGDVLELLREYINPAMG